VNAVKRGSGKSEIIRVRVTANEDGYSSCRDMVTNRMLRIRAHPHLIVGETVVVEVDTSVSLARVVRVVGAQSSVSVEPPEEVSDAPTVLVNGRPLPVSKEEQPVRPGDLRTAWIPFTSERTSERDRGRTGKVRPVVVVAVDHRSATAEVCPVHGANSAVRRGGSGRRLVGWRELGLQKASVVSGGVVLVAVGEIGDLIGQLGPEDRRRLGIRRRG